MAEVASAYVSLIPSAKGFATGVTRETDSAARTASKRFGGIFSGGLRSVIGGALAGVGVTRLLSDSLGEAREAQKVGALTAQVIKTTGGAANVTAKQVGNLATSISNKVGVDDEAIQSGENMLLTFKNIRNEAGAGNKIFDRAARTTTDLAAAMAAASGGELNMRSASIQMGKALNDPVKGITALSRVGVTFTDQQKKQIKALVDSGHVMDAQKIILKELKSEFGGAAAAQATAGDKARVAWKNLEEQVGTALLPVIDNLATRLTSDVIPAVSKFVTQMQDGTGAGGELVDDLKQIVGVGKSVVGFFNGLPGPVKKYGAELAIAAVVLNKVNNGLVSGRTAVGNWLTALGPAEGTLTRTQKASYALGVGLRNLAGAGGMLAVVDGANRSNKAVGAMELTLGGAASGFAAGGPIGAGIGAGIGLFVGLKRAIAGTGDVRMPSPKQLGITDIINSLDEANGKATEFSRNSLFDFLKGKTKGAPPLGLSVGTSIRATAKLYGIPDKQLVDAMTGDVKQFERIKARLNAAVASNPNNGITAGDQRMLIDNIRQANKGYREQALEIRQAISANGDYKKLLQGFPKSLVTKIETVGLPVTEAGVVRLAKKMNLTPTQIKTVIEATNVPTTLAKVQSVINKGKEWSRLHPSTTVDANTKPARDKVSALVSDIHNLLAGNFTALVDAHVSGPRHRALGGPVLAGRSYIVGETRPELFVPHVSGRIEPKVSMASAAGSNVDHEQATYRATSRALRDSGMVVVSRDTLSAMDLAGAM